MIKRRVRNDYDQLSDVGNSHTLVDLFSYILWNSQGLGKFLQVFRFATRVEIDGD